MMEDKIHFQNAHMTQIKNEGKKGPWLILKNKTNDELGRLDPHYTDLQMFEIMKLVKKAEMIAWNAGIDFGKSVTKLPVAGLLEENTELRKRNDILAEKLQKVMLKGA